MPPMTSTPHTQRSTTTTKRDLAGLWPLGWLLHAAWLYLRYPRRTR